MKKMVLFVQFSFLLHELWSLNCHKPYPFCDFLLTSAKKTKVVIAIYVYASESSCFTLLDNGIGYHAMTWCLEDINV